MNRREKSGLDGCDKRFLSRCVKQLQQWGAPLEGWRCIDIIDVREDDWYADLSSCELCGCANVRYEHVMEHDLYFEDVTVGCICAGIMEGNILKARERERLMANRSKRKKNFLKHKWQYAYPGVWYRTYRGSEVVINKSDGRYTVRGKGGTAVTYKGGLITDFYSAVYAAFELADPVEEIL